MREKDAEFVDDMMEQADWAPGSRMHRLALLARRGADAADRIARLEVENIQMQAALGYAICAEDERHIIPSNPFKCGVCDARSRAKKDAPA
jgi:hypothetical protein